MALIIERFASIKWRRTAPIWRPLAGGAIGRYMYRVSSGEASNGAAGVLDEVTSWLSLADEMRAKLLNEKESLTDRLRQIDGALARIPAAAVNGSPMPALQPVAMRSAPAIDVASASLPQLVLHVLTHHDGWMTSGEVIEALGVLLSGAKRAVDPPNIYSVLYRLSTAGTILGEGSHGSRRYAGKEAK